MFWKDFLLKLLSLKSPHGGKPPLAPLTDRNKPAVRGEYRYSRCVLLAENMLLEFHK